MHTAMNLAKSRVCFTAKTPVPHHCPDLVDLAASVKRPAGLVVRVTAKHGNGRGGKAGSRSGGQPQGAAAGEFGNEPMTPEAASRIQSAAAKASGGKVSKGIFAARAQAAAARNAAARALGKGLLSR